MNYYAYFSSPMGTLLLLEENNALSHLTRTDGKNAGELFPALSLKQGDTPLIREAKTQLEEYFCGNRRDFLLPLALKGTAFQNRVWDALCIIPFGEPLSYRDIVVQIGNPKACQEVGMANHHNPIMIVVPCHRMVGTDGSLTGYTGCLDSKAWLLEDEKRIKMTDNGVNTPYFPPKYESTPSATPLAICHW